MHDPARPGTTRPRPARALTELALHGLAAQKIDQQRVDVGGTFLLDPVARLGQQHLAREARHVGFERFVGLRRHADHAVLLARDEQRRLLDARAVEERRECPVAIEIAIPVDGAAKAALAELRGEHVEIGVAEPGRQRVGIGEAVDETRVFRERHEADARVLRMTPALAARRVVDAEQRAAHVLFEFALDASGRLEILLVEVMLLRVAGEVYGRAHARARQIRHAAQRERAEQVGPQQRRVGRDDRPPVVADDRRLANAQRVDEPDEIAGQMEDVVGGGVERRLGVAVSALIGGDDAITRRRQRLDLMPPRVPGLGPAVAEQHERTFAVLDVMHADAVGIRVTMLEVCAHEVLEWSTRVGATEAVWRRRDGVLMTLRFNPSRPDGSCTIAESVEKRTTGRISPMTSAPRARIGEGVGACAVCFGLGFGFTVEAARHDRAGRSRAQAPVAQPVACDRPERRVETRVEKREMADARRADLRRREPQMRRAAEREIAQQTFDGGNRAERIVGDAECERGRAQSGEARDQRGALLRRAGEGRARVGILETRAAAAPRERDAARRVFHPAKPRRRNIAAQMREHGHRDVPLEPHREAAARRVIAPVGVLRAHREDAAHVAVRRREPEREAADAVRDHVDRLARKRYARVAQRGLAVAFAPLEPAGVERGEVGRTRFADTAIVVEQHVAAVPAQPGGEAEVVAAAHRRGGIDDHNGTRARLTRWTTAPDISAEAVTVGGDQRDALGRRVVVVEIHGVSGAIREPTLHLTPPRASINLLAPFA
ncbi:hypothetical protein PT2222_290061 [Paraburkholderia tropica]